MQSPLEKKNLFLNKPGVLLLILPFARQFFLLHQCYKQNIVNRSKYQTKKKLYESTTKSFMGSDLKFDLLKSFCKNVNKCS